MLLRCFLVLLLFSACNPRVQTSQEKPLAAADKSPTIKNAKTSAEIEKPDPFPQWLVDHYPAEKLVNEYYSLEQSIQSYTIINDSLTYCIYMQNDGICAFQYLVSFINRSPRTEVKIAHGCDQSIYDTEYIWLEFEEHSIGEFLLRRIRESVLPVYIDSSGAIIDGKDNMQVETRLDTLRIALKIKPDGQLLRDTLVHNEY